jgi:hypothetical protein
MYMAGELIAVPMDAAQELHAKRLALPLDLLVPIPPAATVPEESGSTSGPLRQPGGIVRKA